LVAPGTLVDPVVVGAPDGAALPGVFGKPGVLGAIDPGVVPVAGPGEPAAPPAPAPPAPPPPTPPRCASAAAIVADRKATVSIVAPNLRITILSSALRPSGYARELAPRDEAMSMTATVSGLDVSRAVCALGRMPCIRNTSSPTIVVL
jgi:hypothetical protein